MGSQVVALGGGHGLARALAALRTRGQTPTAVVTVADDGGSSGRLRRDLGIIAPGDLRMALLALSRRRDLAELLSHRFDAGELDGHALGNLFLVALAREEGDFVAALDRAAALLDCAGRVLPSTTTQVTLHARVDGVEVAGQRRITKADGRVEGLRLEPSDAPACPEAVAAIEAADVVVLGPGSLYTSVMANLLVPGIHQALAASSAAVVYVANLRTQPGETAELDAADHVGAVLQALPRTTLDAVVLHDGPVPTAGGGRPLGTDLGPAAEHVGHVERADLAERDEWGDPKAAHDVERLGGVLEAVLGGSPLSGARGSTPP